MLTPFPAMDPRISVANGVESQWLNSTELVFWRFGTTFFRVEINTGPDEGIGEPREWFSDPRFVDTPGQSYTISPAGGVVYLAGTGAADSRLPTRDSELGGADETCGR